VATGTAELLGRARAPVPTQATAGAAPILTFGLGKAPSPH